MLLFVGLIPFAHRNRETSQESGIKAWFDTGASGPWCWTTRSGHPKSWRKRCCPR